MNERATHLLSWLDQGYTHCQHGSQDWCEGYLHNAKETIEAQDERIAALMAERAELIATKRDQIDGLVRQLREATAITGADIDVAAHALEMGTDLGLPWEELCTIAELVLRSRFRTK